MSAFDDLKNKAAQLAEQAKESLTDAKDNLEKISDAAIEKVGDAADSVTGGKFADKIDAVQSKAHDLLNKDDETPTDQA